jgi:hypothetical protein
MKVCHYTGFYSSLNDEMGPNGDNFKTTYPLRKRLFSGSHLGNSSLFSGRLLGNSGLFSGRGEG